jgi:hypothetical protein
LGQNEHPTTETYGAFVSALRIIHETVCLYMNLKPTYLEKNQSQTKPKLLNRKIKLKPYCVQTFFFFIKQIASRVNRLE